MFLHHLSTLCIFASLVRSSTPISQAKILKSFDEIFTSLVSTDDGLFDQLGSLDFAVWKREGTGGPVPLFSKSYGKSQVKNVSNELSKLHTSKPSGDLNRIADKYMPMLLDVSTKDGEVSGRNQYRIASITKTFIGLAANLLNATNGLDLDAKISPNYVNLSTLGMAHLWNAPNATDGYNKNTPTSSEYIKRITFRHLLTHTSGLSRESMKNGKYSYASSRTHTPRCPPEDEFQGKLPCSQDKDNNWRPWIQHVVSYMMPACGYFKYPEMSSIKSCMPGEYYHYSNAAYSILGLSLDSFIKKNINASMTLEDWITKNVIEQFKMEDTVFTWVDFNKEQKSRTTHGCYGGLGSCDQKRALTDYGDRGIKTPPGGIWSTTSDLAKYLLLVTRMNPEAIINVIAGDFEIHPKFDERSEEDPSHMPLTQFKYGHGWYVAKNYTCSMDNGKDEHFIGAWGTVPGFTSYAITNPVGDANKVQYAVVLVRSYNYNGRLNLGNQARRLLWRLLHKSEKIENLACPVQVFDNYSEGDILNSVPASSVIIKCGIITWFMLFFVYIL